MIIYIVQRLHKEVDVCIMGRTVGVRLGSDGVDGAVGILWAFRSEDEAKAFAEGAPVIVAKCGLDDTEAPPTEPTTCCWQENEDGNWETACGGMHTFMADGPAENHHKFCPYCGRYLLARVFEQEV